MKLKTMFGMTLERMILSSKRNKMMMKQIKILNGQVEELVSSLEHIIKVVKAHDEILGGMLVANAQHVNKSEADLQLPDVVKNNKTDKPN